MGEKEPVTLVVRHHVRPGKEPAFEEWMRGISRDAQKFEGHLGYNVIRPHDPRRPEYLVLFRFDSLPNLEVWEQSETRRQWLDQTDIWAATPSIRERHTGMEAWFSPPAGCGPPLRWKMALVTLFTIYPLILLVQAKVAPLLAEWPLALRTLLTAALLVSLMTYAAMPLTTRLFSKWLYGKANPVKANEGNR